MTEGLFYRDGNESNECLFARGYIGQVEGVPSNFGHFL